MSEYQIRIINFVAVSLFLSLSRKLWSSESCRPVSFPVCVCVLLAYNVWIDVATVALPIAFWNKLQSSSCHIAQVHHKRIHILLAIMSTVSHLLLANCVCLCDCSMCSTLFTKRMMIMSWWFCLQSSEFRTFSMTRKLLSNCWMARESKNVNHVTYSTHK